MLGGVECRKIHCLKSYLSGPEQSQIGLINCQTPLTIQFESVKIHRISSLKIIFVNDLKKELEGELTPIHHFGVMKVMWA